MSGRYFGTDGIRGAVGGPLLEKAFVQKVGAGVGAYLRECYGDRPLHVVIGRDTRRSGEEIALWLMEGLALADIRAFDARVVPTPAVARAVADLDLNIGIAVTASHNPASDNGIKLFSKGGLKFGAEEEARIEDFIERAELPGALPVPAAYVYDARRHYRQFVEQLLPENALVGWCIAVDTANGATSETTPDVLRDFGARVYSIGDSPDGENINDGVGSEHVHALRELVVSSDARLGIAHDGDGDRLVLVDEKGAVVDGDALIALLATRLLRRGELPGNTVVATVMSNMALDRIVADAGGRVVRTSVGDRNVLQAMLDGDYALGGEASGHIILRSCLPTGDGLVAALAVLRIMIDENRALSDLVAEFKPFPQKLVGFKVKEKTPLDAIPGFLEKLGQIDADLGSRGRTLVRYSGTEPKIRLLVEAETDALVEETHEKLHSLVTDALHLIS